jgi:uncharacterized OB-fold protein
MDLTRAHTGVVPFAARTKINYAERSLVGSRCDGCGTTAWPGRPVCQRCGAVPTTEIELRPTGTLVSFTTIHIPRPGLPAPYVLGQVYLDDGLTVFAVGRDLAPDSTVPLSVRLEVSREPGTVPPFAFVPVSAKRM